MKSSYKRKEGDFPITKTGREVFNVILTLSGVRWRSIPAKPARTNSEIHKSQFLHAKDV